MSEEERAIYYGYASALYDPCYEGTWASAYWRKREAEALKRYQNILKVGGNDAAHYAETLSMVRAAVQEVEAEEAARLTWTHSQWMGAEGAARRRLLLVQAAPPSPFKADDIAHAQATLAFYQAAQFEALENLLEARD